MVGYSGCHSPRFKSNLQCPDALHFIFPPFAVGAPTIMLSWRTPPTTHYTYSTVRGSSPLSAGRSVHRRNFICLTPASHLPRSHVSKHCSQGKCGRSIADANNTASAPWRQEGSCLQEMLLADECLKERNILDPVHLRG